MQKILLLIASLFYFNFILAENEIKSWQGIHETPLSCLEQQFAEPPVEFANHVIWGWEGKMDKKTICNDLDSIKKKGFRAVIFIIRKTKCFDFWERNVLFPKTKRSFFRTPTPLPCPFPLNFSLLIITKKFGNLAKNRYICIV